MLGLNACLRMKRRVSALRFATTSMIQQVTELLMGVHLECDKEYIGLKKKTATNGTRIPVRMFSITVAATTRTSLITSKYSAVETYKNDECCVSGN